MENISMGKKLKILRGTKSKEEVAYKVGITTVALMNYETGTRCLRMKLRLN